MERDLNALKTEIQTFLEQNNFAIFHGCSRIMDDVHMVHWDVQRYPEFASFLAAAQHVGVKMIVVHHREFLEQLVDTSLERLEDCEMPPEDRRELERRLDGLRMYDGFTCAIELSFDYQDRTYIFDLRTDWYDDFLDAIEEIEPYYEDDDDDEEDEEGPIGGYYSRN